MYLQGVADLNGDGIPDIILQNFNSREGFVWYMTGSDGTVRLSSKSLNNGYTTSGWYLQGAVDMDKNGRPDLLWQHPGLAGWPVYTWYMTGADGSVLVNWRQIPSNGSYDLTNWFVIQSQW
jgi:hypothetical protein